jgi:hypothetical protein
LFRMPPGEHGLCPSESQRFVAKYAGDRAPVPEIRQKRGQSPFYHFGKKVTVPFSIAAG